MTSKERTLSDDANRLAEAGWPMSAVRVREAQAEIDSLTTRLTQAEALLQDCRGPLENSGWDHHLELAKRIAALSGDSSAPHTHTWIDGADPEQQVCTGCDSTRMTPDSAPETTVTPEFAAGFERGIVEKVLKEVEGLTEGRTDPFWSGVSTAVEEVTTRLKEAWASLPVETTKDDYTKVPEVMNPPASAAQGAEARNLTRANVMGLEEVHRAAEARPVEAAPLPSIGDSCPTCGSGRIGQSGYNLRCANCGWLGPRVSWAPSENGKGDAT